MAARRLFVISYTTTNQKHAKTATDETKKEMGPWGNTGEVEYHCFGGNSDQ